MYIIRGQPCQKSHVDNFSTTEHVALAYHIFLSVARLTRTYLSRKKIVSVMAIWIQGSVLI
jgi:hypothetical protein